MKQLLTICLIASLLTSGWAACTANSAGIKTCTSDAATACHTGYSFANAACTQCDAGKYSAGDTTATCTACPAGKYCDQKNAAGVDPTTADAAGNAITAKDCPAGSRCPEGSAAAIACDLGTGSAASSSANPCALTCTDTTKVKTCGPTAGDVVSCRDGFVKVSTACEACGVENAATCPTGDANSARMYEATTCKTGFFLTAATGVKSTTNKDKCEACAEGCFACASKTNCTKAQKGFKLSGTAGSQTPAKCDGSGKTNLTDDHALTDCATACTDANCLTCNAAADKCTHCKPNFEAKADKCESIATTKHATCAEADKAADATACTKCDDALQREPGWNAAATPTPETRGTCKCKSGFREPEATATDKQCLECGKDVATCDKDQALTCKTATNKVAGKDCLAPTDTTAVGFFYDSTAAAFKACDGSCATCSGAGATNCKTCAALTVPSVVPKEGDADFSKYLTSAFFANNTCFKLCPTGFKADSAQQSCVVDEGSNSVLISALALIFSLFLIF